MIKLEEGKYYRTANGRKVGPVRIAETPVPDKWALWSDGNEVYEVTGLPREKAFDTQIVAEWVDHYYVFDRSEFRPKLWCDMTPEEKGALLLAHHEGKRIQCFHEGEWVNIYKAPWVAGVAYRVKPEEKRETFHMYGCNQYFGFYHRPFHTHRITFDTIDGEPDCESIKMEKL